ncbi:MAG: HEPN domain-containing protein [Candidatus Nanohalobium sp.]
MKQESREWLEKGEEDLEAARILAENGSPETCMFHLQQAVEKAFKGLLIEREEDYSFTHSLQKLDNEAGSPEKFRKMLQDLDTAYTAARYPDAGETDVEEVDERVEETEELFKWIKTQLKR